MERALAQARHAAAIGEVPVGAVLFRNGSVLAEAHNLIETTPNATAHAEMLVLNEAARLTQSWRLEGVTLYVTLEPCPMCAGAMVLARISRLVYGAPDPSKEGRGRFGVRRVASSSQQSPRGYQLRRAGRTVRPPASRILRRAAGQVELTEGSRAYDRTADEPG